MLKDLFEEAEETHNEVVYAIEVPTLSLKITSMMDSTALCHIEISEDLYPEDNLFDIECPEWKSTYISTREVCR